MKSYTYLLGYLWVDSAMAPVGPLRDYAVSCRLCTLSELVPPAVRRLCGHQLVTPKGAAIGQARWLDAAAKTEQVEGMDLVALGQHRNVEAPVVGGGAKAMDQQQGRTDRLVGTPAQAMDGMALVTPGELLHPLG